MAKLYEKPFWFRDMARQGVFHWPGGEIKEFETVPLDKCTFLGSEDINSLIKFLYEEGSLNHLFKFESREPDLKITHRLLDIIEKVKK